MQHPCHELQELCAARPGHPGRAVGTGLVLGAVYGWAGAQSLLGSTAMPPAWQSPTFVEPALPWVPLAIIVVATAVLTLVAAVVPTRLATRVAPVEALAA